MPRERYLEIFAYKNWFLYVILNLYIQILRLCFWINKLAFSDNFSTPAHRFGVGMNSYFISNFYPFSIKSFQWNFNFQNITSYGMSNSSPCISICTGFEINIGIRSIKWGFNRMTIKL